MRTVIVGDVHGCLDELVELVQTLQLTNKDQVVFIGDLLDKGPDSAGVVRYVRELSSLIPVTLVKGNHEEKHEKFRLRLRSGGAEALKGFQEMEAITAHLSSDDVAFLSTAVLWAQVPGGLAVHAGIPMNLETLTLGSSRKEREIVNQVLRVRYVRPSTGKMVSLGQEVAGDVYWAEVYDGRFGHVYFGHEPFGEVTEFPHATGLDTSCVYGDSLTAVVLENNKRSFVSVQAHKKWALRMGEHE